MAKVNPKFVYDEQGKKVGVILSIKDFEKCVGVLEDYQDYQLIQARSSKKEKLIPLEKVLQETIERLKK